MYHPPLSCGWDGMGWDGMEWDGVGCVCRMLWHVSSWRQKRPEQTARPERPVQLASPRDFL